MILKLAGGLLLLVGLAGVGVFVLAQQQTSVGAGLKPVIVSTKAADSFDRKVDAMNAAASEAKRTGKAQTVVVSFTEEELTSKASQSTGPIGDTGLAATGTQVHLSGGNVVATSRVTLQGVAVSVGVVATPVVVNGRTQIVVKEIQTGAVALPDAVKAQLNAAVGQAIDPAKLGLPLDVTGLAIVDGKLVVTGTMKP